ncbi:MAG: PIG-L family deacetylase [Pseudomonadota bacterium]
MTPDQARLMEQAATSGAISLWRTLLPLKSVTTVLQTGAHPDDETSALLARLSLGDGMRVAFACAVRGEGGQNAIGTEAGPVLGVLRTAEMARAADMLDMELYWLNEAYDGTIVDFGFSKSGEETFARWGHDRLLERLVRVIRTVKPDIVLPTFLDIPGQHGHHRAVTIATEEAFFAAADPDVFPQHLADGLTVWQAQKYYLPAWSGAGGSYDDEEPPPPTTVEIETGGYDPMFGATYTQIGQWSRAYHQTQGMGRWVDEQPHAIPLHRKQSLINDPDGERGILEGLPGRLRDLVDGLPGTAGAAVERADAAIDEAFAAYPDGARIAPRLADALSNVRSALDEIAGSQDHPAHAGRLKQKARQLTNAIVQATGLVARVEGPDQPLAPGEPGQVMVHLFNGGGRPVGLDQARAITPDGWEAENPAGAVSIDSQGHEIALDFAVPTDADPIHPYRFGHAASSPSDPVLARLDVTIDGTTLQFDIAARQPVWVTPAVSVSLPSAKTVRPLNAMQEPVALVVEARSTVDRPVDAVLRPTVPEGWSIDPPSATVHLAGRGSNETVAFSLTQLQPVVAAITVPVSITIDDTSTPARTVRKIDHPHIRSRVMVTDAAFDLAVVDVAIDRELEIGVVEGGSDSVADWIALLGPRVTKLTAEDLTTGDLGRFDTIVVGIMAYGTRPDLHEAGERLKQWVEDGGNLVTQYNRPWDRWDPDKTPPRRLEIGQPSLRWRVTDQNAAVTMLEPGDPLLTTPNRIGPADWEGWHKERGLYFAKSWDAAYTPLLSMADPGEEPHLGSLLSARIGRGRHTHVCLILHHQMNHLVPGAFRLMANLLTPPDKA